MNRLTLFSLIVWCSFSNVMGQSNYDELLHLSYDYFSPANFRDTKSSLNQQQFNFSRGFGFELNSNADRLNLGLEYRWLQLETDLVNDPVLSIHNTSLGLEWMKNWKNPMWASTITAGIAAVSDYKTEATSAYQTALAAMLHHGKSSDLVWTFGALYSDQPFGPWVFPILGVDWRISDRYYFSTILFSHAYLEYAIKPKVWYAGVDVREMGISFVLSDYQNQADSYITSFSESFPYYPYTISVFNDFYIKEYLTLFFKTGVLVSRENRHFINDHETFHPSIYNYPVEESFYLRLGAALRIRKF